MNRFILSILALSFPLKNNTSDVVFPASSLGTYFRIILLLRLFSLPGQVVFSQSYSSKDNYMGAWETPASWDPVWTVPQTLIILGGDFVINGYVTANGSLSFIALASNLIINDTLVIKGDLILGSFNNLTINGNGILIIRGNLRLESNPNIITNNYIVITGYIWKLGSANNGSFVSNSNPTKVFVGAYVYPTAVTNKPNFPALNCTAPITTPYLHSNCSYGDMTDFINDPIYTLFQSICTTEAPIITAGGPTTFCAGGNVTLTSSTGISYLWSTGATTASINATSSGSYTVQVTITSGCQSAKSAATVVNVNSLPLVNIISSSSSMCINDLRVLSASPTGGTFVITDGPGNITENVLSATGTGIINLEYNYTNVCTNKATQSIIVNVNPIAKAGTKQELKFVSETDMNAELSSSETGEWSLISGSGIFGDIHSPTSRVTELSSGENKFLWTVQNANCESSAEVIIYVYDPFIPSVITPDGDGKNDYFKISEIIGKVELIIFNRWGNEEYTNSNYLNDWDGRNNKGKELPNDTYFYVLKFGNVKIKKGSVLIIR